MKEAWRAVETRIGQGYEVMMVARPEIREARMSDVVADLEGVLRAVGALG
jgi:hypothetical protein